MPVGKVPLLQPPSRPLTPRRLPRPRVFIKQQPRAPSIDVAAVVSATGPDGADQRCLITRPVERPWSQALTPPSSIAVTPRTSSTTSALDCPLPNSFHSHTVMSSRVGAISSSDTKSSADSGHSGKGSLVIPQVDSLQLTRSKLPPPPPPPCPSQRRLSSDTKFYFSDDEAGDRDRSTNSRRVRSLRSLRTRRASTSAATNDDLCSARSSQFISGSVSPASAPPTTLNAAVKRNTGGFFQRKRLSSETGLHLASDVADRPRTPVANAPAASHGNERHYSFQNSVQVIAANESADALSRVRRAVSALRSLSFQNGCSEDLDTAWGQATASHDEKGNLLLRKDRISRVDCKPIDALDADKLPGHGFLDANGPNSRNSLTGRKWRRSKAPVPPRGVRDSCDGVFNAGIDAECETDIEEESSEPGPNLGRGLGIGRGLGLSMRRASERVERELGDETDGEENLWPDGMRPNIGQRKGRLSAVYAAVPWNRPGRRSILAPGQANGIALSGLTSNFGSVMQRQAHGSSSTTHRRPPSTRAHVHSHMHGAGHIPAWQRKSLWSHGTGRREILCRCGNGLLHSGCGTGNGCSSGSSACCSNSGGAAEAAARLLLSGGGHALLAASTNASTENVGGPTRCGKCQNHQECHHISNQTNAPDGSQCHTHAEVDKYVEFIHASATREVRARRTLVREKVVNRAQAVFRRRRK